MGLVSTHIEAAGPLRSPQRLHIANAEDVVGFAEHAKTWNRP